MSEREAFNKTEPAAPIPVERKSNAPGRKKQSWLKWSAMAGCACLLVLAGLWFIQRDAASAVAPTYGDDLPGGIVPVLRVGDTLYWWKGLAEEYQYRDGEVYTTGGDQTKLLEGYTAYGTIIGVTAEEPMEDLQMQAGFDASGTVFTDPAQPGAVYVLMTTDWFENTYIRFTSPALGNNEQIYWQGGMYRISLDVAISEVVTELPDGCAVEGALHYIGKDLIPDADFETNCAADAYAKSIEGRAVYADPDDASVIYVYERRYWRGGDDPAWRVCHIWEE